MKMRAFYWSVRRELWENRSVLVAPGVGALLFLVFFLSQMRHLQTDISLQAWCFIAATVVPALALLTGLFYSLDALHGERRDRSILFWKSLPVSDLLTVLSKAVIPLVVIPVYTAVLLLVLEAAIAVSSAAIAGGDVLGSVPWAQMAGDLSRGLTLLPLWQAPLYGWLLLVSGWARRMVLLWAVLVPVAASLLEKIVFGSHWIPSLLGDRLIFNVMEWGGSGGEGFDSLPMAWLTSHTARHITSSGDFWFGLIAALLLLAATVASRRYRQPL